jgi:hypothetical protein
MHNLSQPSFYFFTVKWSKRRGLTEDSPFLFFLFTVSPSTLLTITTPKAPDAA